MAEINECDFCGEEFDYEPNSTCSEHDYCVCNNCEDACLEQLELMGDIESEDDDFDDDWGF